MTMWYRLPIRLAVLLVLSGSVACASTGEGSSGRDVNVLTPEEIRETPATNLYDAVNQLRPRWLQVRNVQSLGGGASDIAVFQGASYLGGSEALRALGVDGIARLRYYDAAEANARLRAPVGRQMPGAIVIEYR